MTRSDKTKTYYIVSVISKETKFDSGEIAQKAGQIIWLSENEYAYASCSPDKSDALHFGSPPAPDDVKRWNGMPWWFRFDARRFKVYKITERTVHERTEELVK